MNAVVEFPTLSTINRYSQIELEYESDLRTLFSWMKPNPRPCFTPQMLGEFEHAEKLLELHQGHINDKGSPSAVQYVVFGSRIPGVFNLGGDLSLFIERIMARDRAHIHHYARLCIDLIYRRHIGFGANITTIGLVQGKALGGGFECALACDLIVAERSATFSFPESLFNLFPGMGALSFLSRRIGTRKAEEMCASADTYTAEQLHQMGVVDRVVDDGTGVEAVRRLVSQRNRHANTHRALKAAKAFCQPVSEQELVGIVDVWTDAAMKLDSRDLKMMARLVKAQDRLASAAPSSDEVALETMFAQPAVAASA